MYQRVLVPLDGSDVAETILPFVEKVAGPLDAEVLLLRVVEPIAAAVGLASGEVGAADRLLEHRMAARRYLQALAERFAARGLRVRTRAALGVPATEIVATAEAERADLIAMTTHGRSGVRRLVFGSVAEEVLRAAAVPVLLFRMPAGRPTPVEEARKP